MRESGAGAQHAMRRRWSCRRHGDQCHHSL